MRLEGQSSHSLGSTGACAQRLRRQRLRLGQGRGVRPTRPKAKKARSKAVGAKAIEAEGCVLLGKQAEIRKRVKIEPYLLTYERLQSNTTREMLALTKWLGVEIGSEFDGMHARGTDEDVKNRLTNFDKIETELKALDEPSSKCLLKQMRSTIIEEFEPCPNPWSEKYFQKHGGCKKVDPIPVTESASDHDRLHDPLRWRLS
ncbi:hypothetical protein CYMTET_4430 [Cymbomonas tetramitiformis]|uniref:Uncharacterized protein n=1 Tax=Cymbomonas tetramitiformis TaxID=36881 RepID=A0AAE0LJW0_9CHLO|nr:hypothetical protein CYMTET_4430 [Cymbomonas tetramitiformis]